MSKENNVKEKRNKGNVDLFNAIMSRPFTGINLSHENDMNMILSIHAMSSFNEKNEESSHIRLYPIRYKAEIKVIDDTAADKNVFIAFSKILRMINKANSVISQKYMIARFINDNETIVGSATEDHVDSYKFKIKSA